jgi:hypothetical protein
MNQTLEAILPKLWLNWISRKDMFSPGVFAIATGRAEGLSVGIWSLLRGTDSFLECGQRIRGDATRDAQRFCSAFEPAV